MIFKTAIKRFVDMFYSAKLPFRTRIYNILSMTGVGLSLVSALNAFFTGNTRVMVLSLTAGGLTAVLMFLFTKYKLMVRVVTIVAIFCVIFPLMYVQIGHAHAGGEILFGLAILVSALMFEKRSVSIVICAALIVFYSAGIVLCYFPPISREPVNYAAMREVLICFTITAAAISTIVIWLVSAYERQTENLRIADQYKTEFLDNLSHEIRTPLTTIKGYAQYGDQIIDRLPQGGKKTNADIAELRESMQTILRASEHLSRMSSQLLDISMIEQGVLEMNIDPCRVSDITNGLSNHFNILFSPFGNTLTTDIPPELPLVAADRDKFRQIIFNLIKNANRHTKDGHITISAFASSGNVIISVKDTGSGIKAEMAEVLFKKYPQTKALLKNHEHGLGLYICSRFVRAMGGNIWIEKSAETENIGTEIRFSLPIIRLKDD
jgi:signal transduction histidine kinase